MITLRSAGLGLALLTTLGVAGAAHADFTQSRTTFNAANPGLPVLTFEGIAPNGGFVKPAPNFTAQGVTFSSPGFGTASNAIASKNFAFNTPTDVFFIDQFGATLDMLFSPGVGAVGFDLAAGYSGGPVTVTALNGATVLDSETFTTTGETDFTTFAGFFGFGQNISEVTFAVNNDANFPLIDNLAFGNGVTPPPGVPEPSQTATMGLGLLGLASLAFLAKRRKTSVAA